MAGADIQHKIAWQPQPGPQTLFVQAQAAYEVGYGGSLGGGKLLSDNELVVTPFGYRKHGDLRVGDTICAADGTPTKVVLVTPRAVHHMYRVEFDDGSSVVAGDEHLWNYSVIGAEKRKTGQKWRTGTTEQILERMDAGRKVAIPLCDPVKFTKGYHPDHNPRKLSPYLMGVLLGDGNITGGNVRISSKDDHVLVRATKHCVTGGWVTTRTVGRTALSCDARGDNRKDLIDALERLGVYGKLAHEKSVPEPYKWLCEAERYGLIQGLMDTDGYIDERGQAYFTSTSEQLAEDVRWLVFSLGGRARITSKIPTYTHNGEKLDGRRAYTVTIRMPDNRLIVSLPRKVERANAWRENGHGELKRRIKSIEYVGDEECHCIAISHTSQLYMVGDFIVTHNTDALLGDFAVGIDQGSGYKGVFFRKHFPDMDDVIQRSIEIFAPVYGQKCYNGSKFQWNFPNGAILQFRALERDADVNKYIGQQYTVIMWDQLEQWDSPWPYTFLMTRNRSAKGFRTKIRAAFNPGGIGSEWVRARFIDPMDPGVPLKVETYTKGKFYWRVFIPAKLEDNQILMRNDPDYGDRIYEMHDKVLAEALRQGLWDSIAGAAFPEFKKDIHVIDPAPMPSDKPIIRSLDWGYKTPYAGLWGFPTNDGDFVIGNEIYGWSGVPNVGTEESPETVRRKIETYESAHEIYVPLGMLDNQCWEQDGRASVIAEQLGGSALGWKPWPKGPNSRINQKMKVHEFLKLTNGKPRLYIMRNCRHLIRTLPSLPRAENNWEDVDTHAEDHAYDALRALLTRKVPTRDQIRKRALRRRMEAVGNRGTADLPFGSW